MSSIDFKSIITVFVFHVYTCCAFYTDFFFDDMYLCFSNVLLKQIWK